MPTSLLVIADTHIPKRARDLPAAVWAAVEEADLVFHAGDWVSLDFLDALRRRSRRLLGCYGNNDGPELRQQLPEVAHARIEELEFAVVHETGSATGRERRMDALFGGVDVLLFGHSHIPWDSTSPAGLRLLNPGSPTDRRRQPACSYLTAVVDGREVSTELHRL